MRDGRIVSARVAGGFDPILEALRRQGALSEPGWQAAIEALGRSERKAGRLAVEVGGARDRDVREALRRQARRRLSAILERAMTHGRDAWLEPRVVTPSEQATSLPVETLFDDPQLWGVGLGRRPARTAELRPHSDPAPGARDRRALRRLAFALHPDRHPNLSAEARAALAAELARATAAFHGIG